MTSTMARRAIDIGFTDLHDEADVGLEVEGEIPAWLDGGLVRNGPAQWVMPEGRRLNHWFDGAAMLHRFDLSKGQVHYRNRWLDSDNRRTIDATGRNAYGQYDTDPKRSWFQKLLTTFDFELQFGNNDLITVAQIGTDWIAASETPNQLQIDITDLSTTGVYRFKDRMLTIWTNSHMVADPNGRRVDSFSTMGVPLFGRYHLWHTDGSHRRVHDVTIKDRRPSWMHSFGVSDNHLIVTAFPFRCRTWRLFFNSILGEPFIRTFRWHPDEPTVTYLVDRRTGEVVRKLDLPTMFAFHHVNAWEEDDCVVFDLVAYADPSAIAACRFDHLFSDAGGHFPSSQLHRYRIPRDGGEPIGPQVVSDAVIEMPRWNETRTTKTYRYVYGYSFETPGNFYDQLVKIDTHGADPATNAVRWSSPGAYPSEPVFVPRPGATEEDDGVVVSVVLDVSSDEPVSYLLVLDGSTFQEVGRARAPHPIPFGLHGAFVGREGP